MLDVNSASLARLEGRATITVLTDDYSNLQFNTGDPGQAGHTVKY